jgi:predicted transcriptional regulator
MPSSAERPARTPLASPELLSRVKRIETKLTRLAEAFHVQVADTADGITVDTTARRVTLPTTNRTFASVLTALTEAGAVAGDMYVIVVDGDSVATLRV